METFMSPFNAARLANIQRYRREHEPLLGLLTQRA
jgi:hypothetical protein